MRIIFVTIFLSLFLSLMAQNNALVLKDNPYIVLNGGTVGTPVYLVVNQSHANGIVTQGATGGNLISENEYNYIKWMVGTSTGVFNVPFTTGAGAGEQKIPLTMEVTTAGTGSGDLLFSTYETDDDNLPWPKGRTGTSGTSGAGFVTHFQSSTGSLDNKDWVVDRFWVLDAENYTTKPAVKIDFGFNDDNTEVGSPNTLSVANLGAQRFNSTLDLWEASHSGSNGIWGAVVGGAGTRSVNNVNSTGPNFHRAWTLTDYSHPLPIELEYFEGECNNATVKLTWSASDFSVNSYMVQKSINGNVFSNIGTTTTANNGSNEFQFIDNNPYLERTYYRLVADSNTESEMLSDLIVVNSCNKNSSISLFSPINTNDIHIEIITQVGNTTNRFMMVDLSGKIIFQQDLTTTNKGVNQFLISAPQVASGIYSAILINSSGEKTVAKIVL